MKKKIISLITLGAILINITGCNKVLLDTTYNFNYGYVHLPTGETIEGKVDSWCDYEDGDQLQVTIEGNTYLTAAENVVLVNKK